MLRCCDCSIVIDLDCTIIGQGLFHIVWSIDNDDDARSDLEELQTCGKGSVVSLVEPRDERCLLCVSMVGCG